MTMTDPIADYLTRIRNALMAGHRKVDIPASRMKTKITEILKEEGFVQDYTHLQDRKQGILRIYLKYGQDGGSVIRGLDRISRPGLREYTKARCIPRVLGGMGLAILSTPKGVLSDKEARRLGVGGEIICHVW